MTEQQVQQAFKFALAPTPTQQRAFFSHAGGARFAYNWGLAQIAAALDSYTAEKAAGVEKPTTKIPGHFDLCKQWTAYKDAHKDVSDERGRVLGWVGDNFVGTYQAALRDAAGAWKNFFASRNGGRAGRKMGRPRFKAKGKCRDSFQMHGSTLKLVDSSHIRLPKVGVVKIPGKVRVGTWVDRNARTARKLIRLVRKDRARIVRATISRGASGVWWCSVTAEVTRDIPDGPSRRQRSNGAVGVDLGIKSLASTSTGVVYANSRHLNGALAELKTTQQALSRTERGSNRRAKARLRVGVLHEQVALMRKDALDRITTELVRQHEEIVVEDLNVVGMMANHKLARHIADAGFTTFRWQLDYKAKWSGGRLIVADRWFPSSKTCSGCGAVKTKLALSERTYTCTVCGLTLDRDVNAARNLAACAVQDKPRGGDVRPDAPRRGGRSPVKRDARARPRGRGKAGAPGP